MAKEVHPEVKKFLEKVGYSAAGMGDLGFAAGWLSPAVVQHPVGAPLLGAAIGAIAGAAGAIVHQRGMAEGERKAHEALSKDQFGK